MKASLPYGLLLLLLGLILAVLVVFALGQGAYPLSGTEVLRALAAGFGSDPEAGQNQAVRVVWDLRLPRIAAALLVGAALSTAGAAYQTMFRNPLVSPDILARSTFPDFKARVDTQTFLGFPSIITRTFCKLGFTVRFVAFIA
jgi:iron complex transport system permease protein